MITVKWLTAELEAALEALEHYATHDRECPAVRGWGEPCGCGFYAAKTRLRAAVRLAKQSPDASQSEKGSPTT